MVTVIHSYTHSHTHARTHTHAFTRDHCATNVLPRAPRFVLINDGTQFFRICFLSLLTIIEMYWHIDAHICKGLIDGPKGGRKKTNKFLGDMSPKL